MEDNLASDLLILQSHLDGLLENTQHNSLTLRRFQNFEIQLMELNSMREMLEYILNDLKILFDLDTICICLVDERKDLQKFLSEDGFQEDKNRLIIFLENRELLQSTFGFSITPYLGPYKTSSCGGFFNHPEKKPNSVMIIPLNRRGKFLGSINLGSYNPERFVIGMATDYVEHLAAVIALCIENSMHFEMLRRTSLVDTLTGVNNRRFLEQRIGEEIDRTQRNNESLCCLFLDIDHFKSINDNYGHQAGDLVLSEVAIAIRDELRNIDVLARYGGEEFVALLSDIDESDAFDIAERIRHKVQNLTVTLYKQQIKITISIGISIFIPEANLMQRSEEIAANLLHNADAALYKAKSNGRNKVIIGNAIKDSY